MAVYTDVPAEDLTRFLSGYDIGELLSYKGIAEGVENSNFLVHTAAGNFILTLYEKRVAEGDLPFFLGLMEHLAARGITCPQPVKNKKGGVLGKIAGRPAAIVTFLDGLWIRRPSPGHCAAVGDALARLHLAGGDFRPKRANALSIESWRHLYDHAKARGDSVRQGLCAEIAKELDALEKSWPRDLPQGVIHADLFPDNVFFLGDKLSGLIDFYFACTDTLAYDVAICLNAWCFEVDHSYNVTKGRALLNGLRQGPCAFGARARRAPYPGARCSHALSADAAGGLVGGTGRRAGQAERSAGILPQAALSPDGEKRAGLWSRRMIPEIGSRFFDKHARRKICMSEQRVTIYTDGACSGNPGPGGWGAILAFGDHEKELKGGEPHTTNNRMELMAAISALEALKRPCTVDLHTDSEYLRSGITTWIHGWKKNGWRTSDKKSVKNVDLWKRLDEALGHHKVHWHWVKGHAGHAHERTRR